jgi:hypothetical protein
VITWRQISTYGLISACERYRIGKAIINGRTVYSLFDGLDLVGRYPTASEAKTARSGQEKAPAE